MRICPICLERKVRGNYYYCDECYQTYKEEIHAGAEWVRELYKMYERERKRYKKIKQTEVLLDDYGLEVGDNGQPYYSEELNNDSME